MQAILNKVAILFGINQYVSCPLKNAVNDATALSAKLQELGFNTQIVLNANSEMMERELNAFSQKLEEASVGLFFFAGHAVQIQNTNYLLTTSASLVDETSCKYTSYSLNRVIELFDKSGVSTKIIILDACRNNPFTMRGIAYRGLAPAYAPKGTIIAYSTSPGQEASDGLNDHGVYTCALLDHIASKNITIEEMFKRVRNTVSARTGNKQITWEHTSLMGNFCFNLGYDEGEARTVYSQDALADSLYNFAEENTISGIVACLKSYSWYTQNPAISRISQVEFSHADKDDLFILGRNIYQAACGDCASAVNWIEAVSQHLNRIGGSASIHVLNGILFEIYFDSHGNLRDIPKWEHYENPVKMCLNPNYQASAHFIQGLLAQYPKSMIYIPGSLNSVSIDVIISESDGEYHLDSIYVDGLSCMYNESGTAPYKFVPFSYPFAYPFPYVYDHMNWRQIELSICGMLVLPQSKSKFTFNIPVSDDVEILMPRQYRLQKYL